MFKFVHTADIHLDSPLKSLAFQDQEMADAVGNATRETFSSIVELCISEKVDALIISGDLYDGNQTSYKTAKFLINKLEELHEEGIKVFIIKGNHDFQSKLTMQLKVPDSVVIFPSKARTEIMDKGDIQVALHGISYGNKHIPESLVPEFPKPTQGAFNIGILHTSLGGSKTHDLYAPSTENELTNVGYDYWALGHFHKSYYKEGPSHIVMPGIPQGRDIGESGEKTVSLVSIDSAKRCRVEFRSVSKLQFESINVDVSNISEWYELLKEIKKQIVITTNSIANKILVFRIVLVGSNSLSWIIRRDLENLNEEAKSEVEDNAEIWIEKVVNEIHDIRKQLDQSGLLRTLEELISTNEDIYNSARKELETYCETLVKTLPSNSRAMLGNSETERENIIDELTKEGTKDSYAMVFDKNIESAP